MSYEIVSAHYADMEQSAVIAMTVESGAVLITPDRVDLWRGLIDSEIVIASAPSATPSDLRQYAAKKRWVREVGGFTLSPEVGGLEIASDAESQVKISGAAQAATSGLLPKTIKFKSVKGFVDVTPQQIIGIYGALVAHVQTGYMIEDRITTSIALGEITTTAEIDATFGG